MDWMRDLPDKIKSRPMQSLLLPGSHNSGTASLRTDLPIAIDQPQSVHALAHGPFGTVTKQVVHAWSRCQSLSVGEQLKIGVRYLDFRLAKIPSTSDVVVVHGLYGPDLDSVLLEILGFLTDHPSEVVILDFNHFFGLEEAEHVKVVGVLTDLLGAIAFDFPGGNGDSAASGSAMVSLRDVQAAGKRIILFYHAPIEKSAKFWPNHLVQSPWTQKQIDPQAVFEHQTSCSAAKEQGVFCVNQLIPSFAIDTKTVVQALTTSVEKQSEKFHTYFKTWWPEADKKGLNVIAMNFVNEDFTKMVIDGNV